MQYEIWFYFKFELASYDTVKYRELGRHYGSGLSATSHASWAKFVGSNC